MPNYILSRTSPPAHIYERKINLGYGIKVDVSDAPKPEPNKGKEMNEPIRQAEGSNDDPTAAFADGTVFVKYNGDPLDGPPNDEVHPAEKIAPPKGESNDGLAFGGI